MLVLGVGIGLLLALLYVQHWKTRYTQAIRQDAVQRSQAVTTGKVHEQLVPYLPEFGFNPKDARFLGSPVDLLVFDGLDDGELRRVVFIEIKTGGSTLTGRATAARRGAGPSGRLGGAAHRALSPRHSGGRCATGGAHHVS